MDRWDWATFGIEVDAEALPDCSPEREYVTASWPINGFGFIEGEGVDFVVGMDWHVLVHGFYGVRISKSELC